MQSQPITQQNSAVSPATIQNSSNLRIQTKIDAPPKKSSFIKSLFLIFLILLIIGVFFYWILVIS